MRDRRGALSEAQRREASEAAARALVALPELGDVRGRAVAGYAAVRGELDPAPALAALVGQGARVHLPRVGAGACELAFCPVAPGDVLRAGAFGIPEPAAVSDEVEARALDIVIVPGLAFDAGGGRVGSGGGYYDAALAGVPATERPMLIGVGYDFQIVDRCPVTDADVGVDVVVTETRVLRCGGGDAPKDGG